jgi:hypothetical protein
MLPNGERHRPSMTITQNDLNQFILGIWGSTLGLEVGPVVEPSLSELGADFVVGRVQITGAWQGAVLLECSEELAEDAARIMFDLDSEEPAPEDTNDALAEITNITAGNVKSLVGGQCNLSMPQVTGYLQPQPAATRNGVIYGQAFACEGELFFVTIVEGQGQSGSC